MITVVYGAHLLVLATLPGFGLLLLLRRRPICMPLLVPSVVGVSVAYAVVAALVLLRGGFFSTTTVTICAMIPLAAAGIKQGLSFPRNLSSTIDIRTSLSLVALMGGLVLVVALTPSWTFLISPNMDAGNYETYSNHFWTTGSLYLDAGSLVDRGIPLTWVESKNTWIFSEGSTVGRPAYLYAYPALLGIVKAVTDSTTTSWLVNAFFGGFNLALLFLLAGWYLRSRLLRIGLVALIAVTPLFFYYSKQLMSEQTSLFAMLLLLVALLSLAGDNGGVNGVESGSGDRWWTLTASAGILLLLLVRIDALFPVMALVAVLGMAQLEGWKTEHRFPLAPSTFGAMGVAAAMGAGLTSWLASSQYLRHARLGTLLPQLEGSRLGEASIYLPIGLGIAAMLVGLGLITRQLSGRSMSGRPMRSWPRVRTPAAFRMAIWVMGGGWLLFALWNLTIRPASVALAVDHDAHNLSRLIELASPVMVTGVALLAPVVFRVQGLRRWLPVGLLLTFAVFLYQSNHTSPDVWWMRRYLTFLPGLGIIVLALGIGWIIDRFGSRQRLAVAALAGVIAAGVLVQAGTMRSLLRHEVNVNAPESLATLRSHVRPNSPVIAIRGNSIVRGMVNTLRSLHQGKVILNVDPDDLGAAVHALGSHSAYTVISPKHLSKEILDELSLERAFEGTYERQWTSWMDDIRADPDRAKTASYVLYRSADDGRRGRFSQRRPRVLGRFDAPTVVGGHLPS